MSGQVVGWIIDSVVAVGCAIGLGVLLSLKWKSERSLIIIALVLLSFFATTGKFYSELKKEKTQEATETNGSLKPANHEAKTNQSSNAAQQHKRYTKAELDELFQKIVDESDGSVLGVSMARQGDVIEIDVELPREVWDAADQATKNTMVKDFGKGFDLAVKQSRLYSNNTDIYVSFRSAGEGLASYDNGVITYGE